MFVRRSYTAFTYSCLFFIVVTNLALHCYFYHIDHSIFSKTQSDDSQILMVRDQRDGSENVQFLATVEQSDGSNSSASLYLKNVVRLDSTKLSLSTAKEVVALKKTSLRLKPIGKKFPLTFSSVDTSHLPRRLRERIKTFPQDSEIAMFLKSQDNRLMSEKEYCSWKTKGSKSTLDRVLQQISNPFVVDTEYSITFCPIYKSASSSWLVNLLTMKDAWSESMKGQLQKQVSKVFQRVSAKTVLQIPTSTTKFMVVRHPLDRLISCYRDKFEGASKFYYYKMYGEKMVKMFRPSVKGIIQKQASLMMAAVKIRVQGATVLVNKPNLMDGNPFADPIGPTFEEFIKYVLSSNQDDAHWKPFYMHCSLCLIEYDFVLRFENLYRDSKLFVEYLNMTKVIQTGWENPSSNGTTTDGVVCSYLNQINSDLLKKVISKYEIDFELFHYDTNGYEKCAKDYKFL